MNPGLAREFLNNYDPAETTCFSAKIELVCRADASLPEPLRAGHMLRSCTVCVVDEDLKPVPRGVPGEIVIGEPCIVAGYPANPEATQLKFRPDAFFEAPTPVHRSGDRCRLEGDLQVKTRGFRIELAEVEQALLRAGRHLAAHVVFCAGVPYRRNRRRPPPPAPPPATAPTCAPPPSPPSPASRAPLISRLTAVPSSPSPSPLLLPPPLKTVRQH